MVTQEHIKEAHRGRHTADCSNTGVFPNHDLLRGLVGDASPKEIDVFDSGLPAEAPHEPAPPPYPTAMGNASPVRGLGVAADSAMTEGVELISATMGLDEGVEVDPAYGFAKPEHEVGRVLRGPAEVCIPAAPLRRNRLIRRKVVRANVAACDMGSAVTRMTTKTVYETPGDVACEPGKSTAMRAAESTPGMLAAVNCATLDAEQAAQAMVTPCKAVKTAGGEFRQVAAARKKAATHSDKPDLKEVI